MNHTQRILDRLDENKNSIKTYSSYDRAVSTAEKQVDFVSDYFEIKVPHVKISYIVVGLPNGKFTPIFNLSTFVNTNKVGGFIGILATKGFYCI